MIFLRSKIFGYIIIWSIFCNMSSLFAHRTMIHAQTQTKMPSMNQISTQTSFESDVVSRFLGMAVLGIICYLVYDALFKHPRRQIYVPQMEHTKHGDETRLAQKKTNLSPEQQRLQRLRNLGIEEYLLPYVRDANRVNNVTFIQLRAVNQFDDQVIRPVVAYKNTLQKKLKRMNRRRHLNDEDKKLLKGFEPTATCPLFSVRHIGLLNQFFTQRNIGAIAALTDNDHAHNFLHARVSHNQPTSWRNETEVATILREYDLATNANCVIAEGAPGQFVQAQRKIRNLQQRHIFHLFVVEVGEAATLGIFDETLNRFDLSDDDRKSISRQEQQRNHFYVSAIERRGNNIRYYIVDSIPTHDHINNVDFYTRDKYLCDLIVDGRSDINYRQYLREYSYRVIQNSIENGRK